MEPQPPDQPWTRVELEHINLAQHSYEELANGLQSAFGVAPKPWQLSAIYDVAVHKKDVIVVAGTGSGKSLVFQAIPKAIEGGIILVISPTIALMDDQVCELNSHLRVF
jgi:superfamily II DNA helicase RecQ